MRPEIDHLRKLFVIDAQAGVITRLSRPSEDFSGLRHWRMWNKRFAGRAAGNIRTDGYVMISVHIDGVRHQILGHVLLWALHHGRWPMNELDHIDGVHSNNRIGNLREATRPEQMQNMKARLTQGAGRGVSVDARASIVRYYAHITINRKRRHLGSFDTPEAAHEAYLRAKRELHTFQPVPRDAS